MSPFFEHKINHLTGKISNFKQSTCFLKCGYFLVNISERSLKLSISHESNVEECPSTPSCGIVVLKVSTANVPLNTKKATEMLKR